MSYHVEIELEINGEIEMVDVIFSVYGSYYPATYWEPAEYPELEIDEVTFNGEEITLTDKQIEEAEGKCWEYLDERL